MMLAALWHYAGAYHAYSYHMHLIYEYINEYLYVLTAVEAFIVAFAHVLFCCFPAININNI